MKSPTVLLAGGTGLVGQRLAARLHHAGYAVGLLTRHPTAKGPYRQFAWNPAAGTLDPAALPWADAVVNLAGARITEARWSPARKQEILHSRLQATALLAQQLGQPGHGVRTFVSASAYGYYGDTGERPTTEETPIGPTTDFLAQVCRQWEAAASPVAEAGVRLVVLRLGLVLSAEDGLLKGLRVAARLGSSGGFGSGWQWVSWVHVDDVARLVQHALENPVWQGAYNSTAPAPVRNAELLAAVARQAGRRPGWRVPAALLRLLLGEMSTLLLNSSRVLPARALAQGFDFQYPELDGALSALFAETASQR